MYVRAEHFVPYGSQLLSLLQQETPCPCQIQDSRLYSSSHLQCVLHESLQLLCLLQENSSIHLLLCSILCQLFLRHCQPPACMLSFSLSLQPCHVLRCSQ